MTTLSESLETLRQIIVAHPIYGARFTAADLLHYTGESRFGLFRRPARVGDLLLRWDQSWGNGVSLNIVFETEEIEKRGEKQTQLRVSAELSWPSTSRNVASALTAITLYTQVTQLAALIEAALDGQTLSPSAEQTVSPEGER